MKKQTIGIVAHVDAGKTTCIEAMLYTAGMIRKLGRVDHQDTVMDYDSQERNHGITIYSKEAHCTWKDTEYYLIDTPGHVDFSAEMERSLSILDCAVLIINASDGVQSHTETIWKCLEHYHIPVLVFLNKMDISYLTKEELLKDLQTKCASTCYYMDEHFEEECSLCNEEMLTTFLENGECTVQQKQDAFYARSFFPVLTGSALKLDGIEELMDTLDFFTPDRQYPQEFGGRVYKISNDENGDRLTHIKLTGGTLQTKSLLAEGEKVDQIRIYQGHSYEARNEVEAGDVITVKGLHQYEAGNGLGFEEDQSQPLLNAYMTYELVLPHGANLISFRSTMEELMTEDPQLEMSVDEKTQKIHVQIMGDMQKEILQKKILEKSGIEVGFGVGTIVYRETIEESVDCAGHFEPLRHYAEVHLQLNPLPLGSGIKIRSSCSSDQLNMTWQRSILSTLERMRLVGVLTGSMVTDVEIVLVAGKGNIKHTSGGDFRQATLRAFRQGLMKTTSILLEPYNAFVLHVPSASLSRALFDLQTKKATVEVEDLNDGNMEIKGYGPVRTLINYQNEVTAYTKGLGRYYATLDGYRPSEDAETILSSIQYDPERDVRNPSSSVFCANGAGYNVPWNEADEMMHIQLKQESQATYHVERMKVEEDYQTILARAESNNRNLHKEPKEKPKVEKTKQVYATKKLPPLLIVDGYNMIYGWDELKELAQTDLYSARQRLISILSNYQAYVGDPIIVVFDGYLKKNNNGTTIQKDKMTIIYTKTDQTADAWIEKAGYEYRNKYALSVATSDALIQNSVFSQGALRISAQEMWNRIQFVNQQIQDKSENM